MTDHRFEAFTYIERATIISALQFWYDEGEKEDLTIHPKWIAENVGNMLDTGKKLISELDARSE